MEKIIIIGSGPAGLTAAIYLSRAGFNPLVIGGSAFGGQLMTTTEVDNYPGFEEGITGPELIQKMMKQAKRFNARLEYKDVSKIELDRGDSFKVYVGESVYETKGVIIATGAIPRKLGLKSETKFIGKGVSTCATCDGAFYRDKAVAVVGGGDTAMEEAHFLTRFAKKVYLIHRRDELRATKVLADRLLQNEKVEVLYNSEVKEVLGDQSVSAVKIFNNKENKESNLSVDGLFLAIGHIPVTEIFSNQIETDKQGYIKVFDRTKTSVDGVFVAGDVADHRYRQAITAAGSGCMAALDIQRWLEGDSIKEAKKH